ncbi:hypothetical protein IFM89_029647 [Coptis chinensis]|uniref:Uncharacterized protein n=1 Tax=Coptis chinensis TaxID=261450 RepID=A0A835IIN1_9MAGN|nr:hypothetical protein IFM89_029647 [Coptis chinensis]
MELLNHPSIFKKPPFTTNPSSSNHFNTFFPFPSARNFQISAHFRRHSKRRNSLRKKLSDEQKVSSDTDTTNLQYPFHITDESYLNNSSIDSVEKSKLVMWSKLESWVDQYKKEVEFWGVGSSPIFTVFQDIQGNVKNVVINEDEILRRNRVEPSFYNKRNELGEEVKSTISYAKRLGKEIEIGGYKFPSNSSIAKVVVSGRESGFVDGVRSFVVRPEMYTKLPRIGIGIVCSFFVFWFVKEILFVKNSVVELTREEKEMLRRKMKLRMEKEKLESGSVEVLPVVVNRVMESTVRPQLDKQELMNSFSKAKTPGEELMLPHSSSCVDHETRRFSKKLQEIKEMARHAREIERKSREEHEIVDEDVSTDLEDSEIHSHVSDLSDGDSVKSMDVNATRERPSVEYSPTIENGSIPGRTSIKASENNNFQVPDLDSSAEGSGNGVQSQRDGIRSEPSSLRSIVTEEENQSSENLTIEPQSVDVQPLLEGTFLHPLENSKSKIPAPASTVEGSENGMNTQWDLNNRESNTLQSMGRSQEIPSTDLPDGETYGSNKQPIKVKPKIMLTVKEAREYLSQKRE